MTGNNNLDLTRSRIHEHVSKGLAYSFSGKESKLVAGMCMVYTPEDNGTTVQPSSGSPDEVLAGILRPKGAIDNGFLVMLYRVMLYSGPCTIYTLGYESEDTPWDTTIKTVPILGPNGVIHRGRYPDDFVRSIGRVISTPTKSDPYLGLAIMAWG